MEDKTQLFTKDGSVAKIKRNQNILLVELVCNSATPPLSLDEIQFRTIDFKCVSILESRLLDYQLNRSSKSASSVATYICGGVISGYERITSEDRFRRMRMNVPFGDIVLRSNDFFKSKQPIGKVRWEDTSILKLKRELATITLRALPTFQNPSEPIFDHISYRLEIDFKKPFSFHNCLINAQLIGAFFDFCCGVGSNPENLQLCKTGTADKFMGIEIAGREKIVCRDWFSISSSQIQIQDTTIPNSHSLIFPLDLTSKISDVERTFYKWIDSCNDCLNLHEKFAFHLKSKNFYDENRFTRAFQLFEAFPEYNFNNKLPNKAKKELKTTIKDTLISHEIELQDGKVSEAIKVLERPSLRERVDAAIENIKVIWEGFDYGKFEEHLHKAVGIRNKVAHGKGFPHEEDLHPIILTRAVEFLCYLLMIIRISEQPERALLSAEHPMLGYIYELKGMRPYSLS